MAVTDRKQSTPAAGIQASQTDGQSAVIAEFSKAQELAAYERMLLIRRFEEKAGQMYGMGLIGGFCHLYIGQEAVVIGMQMTIREQVKWLASWHC